MRALEKLRKVSACVLLLTGLGSALRADTPKAASAASVPAPAESEDVDSQIHRGMDLERQKNWGAAIDSYENTLKRWPDRIDVRQRLRLCESHYKLGRRYLDRSFRTVLLHLPVEKTLDLYDEVLERIETYYVEPVSMVPLVRKGLDNLEVALRDPSFLQANALSVDPAKILKLREVLRSQRDRISVRDRDDARSFVLWACDQARVGAGIGPSAVVLEFAYGACDSLDDYTAYLTPDKLDDLFGVIDGNFVGLGVELKVDEIGLKLLNVLKGGPAADAGIRVGEKISHVANQPLKGMGLDEAAGKLQGSQGTAIDLTIVGRDGKSRNLRLIRRPVEVQSVPQARIVDAAQGVGYVQLTGFQKSSTEELRRAISGLERQGMRYLVLDLRGNPGGLLNVAVDIADLFLDSGVIVSTRGRAPNQTSIYKAQPGAPWRMPVSVLVDHDSASASEILAGALKENHRALVLGERSYGKGSVQSIYQLRAASTGLKLTTAKFYSPANRPYSEQGVEPDVAVSPRIVARPAGPDAEAPVIEFGEPSRDPVLGRAIQQARRQLPALR